METTASSKPVQRLHPTRLLSTHDPNLDLQIDALTNAGCKKTFHERTSGSRSERPEFSKARVTLREGDKIVVRKLDRLGRSAKNLVDLVGELHKQGSSSIASPMRSTTYSVIRFPKRPLIE